MSLRTRHGTTLCVSFLHENHSESTDGARGLTYPPSSKTCLSSLKGGPESVATLCVSFLHENHCESTDGTRGLTYPPSSKTCLSSLKGGPRSMATVWRRTLTSALVSQGTRSVATRPSPLEGGVSESGS